MLEASLPWMARLLPPPALVPSGRLGSERVMSRKDPGPTIWLCGIGVPFTCSTQTLTQFALMLIVCFLVFVTSPFALPPSWHDITIVTSRSLSPTLCVPAPPIHLASTSLPLLFSTLPPTMSGTSSETTVDGFPKKTSS